MEKSQDEDIGPDQLIAQQVTRYAEFPNLPRIKFAQPWATAAELQQSLRRFGKFAFDVISTNRVISRHKVDETIDVVTCLGRPSDAHAARVARERALRLAAKCFSTSSCVKLRPSSTAFNAS